MTVRIPKSLIARVGISDLAKAVSEHQAELASWQAHMGRVKADAALPPIPRPMFAQYANSPTAVADFRKALAVYDANVATRHQPYPAPDPHPLVLQALNGFEIFDDAPTPAEVLAAKKRDLMTKVAAAEHEAVGAISPVGKRRINNLREASIRANDSQLAEQALLGKWKRMISVGAALGIVDARKALDVSKDVADARPRADTQHLADQEAIRAKIDSVVHAVAQALSDIDDLTAANVDQFQIPDFSVAK